MVERSGGSWVLAFGSWGTGKEERKGIGFGLLGLFLGHLGWVQFNYLVILVRY